MECGELTSGGTSRAWHAEPFATFLADAPIACHEIDHSGRIIRVNDAECELLGASREELLGRLVWDFVAPEQREAARMAVEAKVAGIRPLTCFEREYQRPDGRRLSLEIREAHTRDREGRIDGIRSFLVDVTDRKRTEQALAERERSLKHLFENATDIVYRADLHGRFTFVNPTAAAILNCPVETLVGLHYLELIRPDWRREAHRFYRRQIAQHIPNTYFEFPCITSDGREIWFGQNVQLVFEDGELTGVQAICRDITDRRRAEDALREAREELEKRVEERTSELANVAASLAREVEQRRISDEERRRMEAQVQHAQRLESLGVLAGGLAHDFNNILTTIVGHTCLALLDLPKDAPLAASMQEVQTAANRAADLVQKMLAYSGKGRMVIEAVGMSKLAADLRNFLKSTISKKAELLTSLDSTLPDIDADPGQLSQVIVNLVANASEALEGRPGTIRVATGVTSLDRARISQTYISGVPEGEYAFLEVTDNGCGMDSARKAKVFDPFFSTKFTGRGLGLAAVLGIVRSHRGTIEVSSAPGLGSTFCVLLPIPQRQLDPPVDESVGEASGAGDLILVAEDELPVQSLARSVLERAHFKVSTASDGYEAFALLKSEAHPFAAVVLDLTMPRMSGDEVLSELRRCGSRLPVVVCSGFAERDVSPRIPCGSATLFLQKPYSPEKLVSAVREALRRSQRSQKEGGGW